MENLTKNILNDQIVAMRHLTNKVKVLTINDLIKKSKKLKRSKGPDGNEPLKKDQKCARLLLEIQEIKKLNADEITKFALMHTGTFSEMAKKGQMKERALARLAEHKLLAATVIKFRSTYPKWQVQVPSIYHIWEFNKKMMGKDLKPTRKEEIVSPKRKERKTQENKIEEGKKEKPKKIKCSNKSKKAKTTKLIEPAMSEALLDDIKKKVDNEDAKDVNRPSLAQLTKNIKSKQPQDLKKAKGDIEIQRFNLNDDVGTEIPVSKVSKSRPKTDALDISKKRTVRSNYFISSDNEDEEVAKDNFDVNEDGDKMVQSKEHLVQTKSYQGASFTKKLQENTQAAFIQKKISNVGNMRGSGISAAKGFTKPQRSLSKVHKQPNTGKWAPEKTATDSTKLATADLHPSWQAKRKQSNALSVAFEGKKIKFGD